jgi:hypothetical protein
MNKQLVRVLATGRKAVVEQVAVVNKVRYYIDCSRTERVYTDLEIRPIRTRQ